MTIASIMLTLRLIQNRPDSSAWVIFGRWMAAWERAELVEDLYEAKNGREHCYEPELEGAQQSGERNLRAELQKEAQALGHERCRRAPDRACLERAEISLGGKVVCWVGRHVMNLVGQGFFR
ncbi:MAG: hypothetical protein WDN49_17825 [Acetobacteraceae bacterium]